jgi:hypothetical protein
MKTMERLERAKAQAAAMDMAAKIALYRRALRPWRPGWRSTLVEDCAIDEITKARIAAGISDADVLKWLATLEAAPGK